MAEIIRMPKMSDTMTEGVIASWLKKVGDSVKSGDVLAEVETDKATMELEAYQSGTLLYIGVEEKESVPVDGMLAIIGKAGEDISSLTGNTSNGGTKKEPAAATPVAAEKQASKVDLTKIKAEIIRMPKMSDTMTEGAIVSWNKNVGDAVKSGELLAEVETDKATMELESYFTGTLLHRGAEKGASVPVDAIIAIIGEKGTDIKPLLEAGDSSAKPTAQVVSDKPVSNASPKPATVSGDQSDSRLKASPLAKRLAREKGIEISNVPGSGENGRIIKRDIENFKPGASPVSSGAKSVAPVSIGKESFEEIPASQMRKTIAKRLAESKFTAPHFYLTMEIDMEKAMEARASMNEVSPVKISFNDMVIKAAAAALRQHPKVNSSWLGDKIRFNHHIHIGMAVAVEEGLLVPVIRFADSKSLSQIASETKDLGGKAKNKQLQPADWEGNTFTVSNLGMFGIEEFTAIINPPDACILAVGGIHPVPVVKNGQVVPGNRMKVTLSCDHRVVDGAIGSAFLQAFKGFMEDPVRILI